VERKTTLSSKAPFRALWQQFHVFIFVYLAQGMEVSMLDWFS
jgi:hypothetical protein